MTHSVFHRSIGCLILAPALAFLACTGSVGGAGPTSSDDPASEDPDRDPGSRDDDGKPGPGDSLGLSEPTEYALPVSDLRRLTRREYNNTVRDLLGDTSVPAQAMGRDAVGSSGFEVPGTIGSFEADGYMGAAEKVAAGAITRLGSLMSCTPRTAAEEVPCARSFIQSFGSRAFRRPIVDAEATDLLTLFQTVKQAASLTFAEAIGAVIQGILQSPNFIYHRERGPDAPVPVGDMVALTNYELASRVSYFIAGTTPDEILLQAAADGKLTDIAELEAQARRLATKGSVVPESLADFVRQWLEIDLEGLEKSPSAYPNFAAARPLLDKELERFLEDVVEKELPPRALYTNESVYVNDVSAKVYGVAAPNATDLVEAQAPGTQRAGVFTQLGFLAAHATSSGSHPVKRGVVMIRRVLCGDLPPPPDDVPAAAQPQPNQTTRQRFEMHSENACASCHKVIDPLGFAFEHYDGMGQWRDTDAGQPVDASGTVTLPSGGDITFDGAVDLLPQLAQSRDARICLARQMARYGTQISETSGIDLEVAKELLAEPIAEEMLTELFMSVVKTRAFRLRTPAAGEVL